MIIAKPIDITSKELPWQIHAADGRLLAGFTYYQEVLDYISYANNRGANVILASWLYRSNKWKFEKRNSDGTVEEMVNE